MEDSRYYSNGFANLDDDSLDIYKDYISSNDLISTRFKEILDNTVNSFLNRIRVDLKGLSDPKDFSIYSGSTGIALLYYRIAGVKGDQNYLKTAADIIEESLHALTYDNLSFLCGAAGPLALGAVVYSKLENQERSNELIEELISLLSLIPSAESKADDDISSGRAGYLHALLFVNNHLKEKTIESDIIRQVVLTILESGRSSSATIKGYKVPLMFKHNNKHYLGTTRGITGIIYTLLVSHEYLTENELNMLVKPTIDFILQLKLPSGNFPHTIESEYDGLVQWCSGASGIAHLFGLAYEIFGDVKYLKATEDCAEVVWSKGLLKKGDGLCHGVAGNTYTFLCLFKITKNLTHLYRACKFAEWCTGGVKHNIRSPDHPLSLFEGIAGTIYIMVDMQEPSKAKFPAFSLEL